MIPGLGSIIERVTGLFGKTYFLAGFFPVLFLAGVSVLAGNDTSRWVHQQVSGFRALDATRQAFASGVLLTVVAMVGFVYWSAAPWFRALLQGAAFPRPLHDLLVQRQQRQLQSLEADVTACGDRAFNYRTLHPEPLLPAEAEPEPEPAPAAPATLLDQVRRAATGLMRPAAPPPAEAAEPDPEPEPATLTWMDRLLAARQQGSSRTDAPPVEPSPALVAAFDHLQQRVWGLEPVNPPVLDQLCTALETEMAAGPAGPGMDRLHVRFESMATSARARAENALNRTLSVRRARFPVNLSVVGPTRMANVAELYRDYALTRYRMDPEVFWLHLQRAAAADDRFRPILEEARLKLDVSVSMAVACGLGSLWALAVAERGHSVPLLVLTGLALPLGAVLFYRATVANLRMYGEAVRATVDLFRFDVLESLHLSLPLDSVEERAIWNRLTVNNQLLGDEEVTYAKA